MRIVGYRNLKSSIVGCFFCLSLLVYPAFGQNRNTISGFVFDPQRIPISQVQVELLNEVDSVVQRVKTDGSGRFFFSGLSSGRFSIKVLSLGTNYEEQIEEVELVGNGPLGRPISDNAQKDVYLRQRRQNNGIGQVTGVVFVQEIPEDARKIYEKAIVEINEKNVDLGAEDLEYAIKLFPNYYLALEKLGTMRISQQKYENALDIFNRAVTVNDKGFYSWYGLSYANYSLKRSKAAIENARKAVSLNPNSVDAFLVLGVSLRQDKLYEESEKSFKQADKVSKGKSPDVHWNLALLYAHNLNRYKDAADELEFYLKTYPDAPNSIIVKKLIKQFRENPNQSTK